jgi:hypothetical protein
VIAVLALVLAALFGAGDQYLGSFSMHPTGGLRSGEPDRWS